MASFAPLHSLVLAAYVAICALIVAHGLYYLWVTVLRWRVPLRRRHAPGSLPDSCPFVTVQLPVYNERHVVERLIDAAARLEWPPDRLEIQVIDDSTDETRALAAAAVERWRRAGVGIHHLARGNREGYKAGALQHGLGAARGEYVAVFDADFLPQPDFLERTLPFFHDPNVASVQTRWAYTNEGVSPLTRAVALGLDTHFVVEQRARSDHGLLLSFNGTACVWRRRAIEEAGGWPAGTLAEDLDLSVEAFLQGWEFAYVDDYATPQEIPVDVESFRRQQYRWARGSMQCARKHAVRILRHRPLPLRTRVAAAFHLLHYTIHPLVFALFALQAALLLVAPVPRWFSAGFLLGSTLGPFAMFVTSQRLLHPREWARRLLALGPLTVLGLGVSFTNTRGILAGLFGGRGEFERTPKYGISQSGAWRPRESYRARGGARTLALEGGVAALAVAELPLLFASGRTGPFLGAVLFAAGLLAVGAGAWASRLRRPL